jgi:hypothetical protein
MTLFIILNLLCWALALAALTHLWKTRRAVLHPFKSQAVAPPIMRRHLFARKP